MSNERTHVVLNIDEKLDQLSSIPSECCIFRVHDQLRKVNEDAYEPRVIAIGPYHHAKVKPRKASNVLQPMEEQKLRYLKQLLARTKEKSVERYVGAMQESEERARKFYAEPISHLDSDKFVEMMLLDSCFIVELLRKNKMEELRDADDPIFKFTHIRSSVRRDLMLFENQLPFFILEQFFEMTKISDQPNNSIMVDLALRYFSMGKRLQGEHFAAPDSGIPVEEIKHLLGLLHYYYCYSFISILSERNTIGVDEFSRFIKPTAELKEAGIKFKEVKGRILFDIRFENGIMEIPTLKFGDNTEALLRNLIAYEQYLPDGPIGKHFTYYQTFMDQLISSSKDVEILRHDKVIQNYLGDDEVVSSIVNKLGDNIIFSSASFLQCYSKLLNDVNQHCSQRWNVWMAKLRRDYFNTPWALISFVAAVVLLLLTITQTIFSILSVV